MGPDVSEPVAVVTFHALESGVDNLTLTNVDVVDERAVTYISCSGTTPNPQCVGATDVKNTPLPTTPTPTPTATATSTPKGTPTNTPTPGPAPVGGIAELPDAAQPSHSSQPYAAIAAAAAAGVVVLGAGSWYARRRWRVG